MKSFKILERARVEAEMGLWDSTVPATSECSL
jgi:hypothetical protein